MASDQAYKGTISTNRDGIRIAEVRSRDTIDELKQCVEINWKADPKTVVKAEFKETESPFRVIWQRNGKSIHYSGKELNDMVFGLLEVEKEEDKPDRTRRASESEPADSC